jgi:hypothetical protein
MKRLLIALALLGTLPAHGEEAKICVWGKQVTLIERMASGRPGYDALFVEANDKTPFFVLLPHDAPLSAACRVK